MELLLLLFVFILLSIYTGCVDEIGPCMYIWTYFKNAWNDEFKWGPIQNKSWKLHSKIKKFALETFPKKKTEIKDVEIVW